MGIGVGIRSAGSSIASGIRKSKDADRRKEEARRLQAELQQAIRDERAQCAQRVAALKQQYERELAGLGVEPGMAADETGRDPWDDASMQGYDAAGGLSVGVGDPGLMDLADAGY
jgi:hypothetical protein